MRTVNILQEYHKFLVHQEVLQEGLNSEKLITLFFDKGINKEDKRSYRAILTSKKSYHELQVNLLKNEIYLLDD